MAEVALEAGNSPDIIFQRFRELVTSETAKEWFGITLALVAAERETLRTEGARLRTAKEEAEKAEKAKDSKKRGGKKASAGAAVGGEAGVMAAAAACVAG